MLPPQAAALTWELQPPRYEMAADEWQKLQRDIQVHRQEMLVPAIGRLLGDELEAMHRDELAAVAARWASASDASGPGPYAQYGASAAAASEAILSACMGLPRGSAHARDAWRDHGALFAASSQCWSRRGLWSRRWYASWARNRPGPWFPTSCIESARRSRRP